jgi:peptidase M23-like protein
VLDFPLRGQWLVVNPPAHPRYAFDIIAVESSRLVGADAWRLLRGDLSVEDSYSWSRPVFVPVAGVVVAAHDAVPDRRALHPVRDMIRTALRGGSPYGSMESIAGNHVIVRCDAGDVLLAHLREGSVRVTSGDRLEPGTVIGEVGNSGNSVTPHLHLQLSAPRGRLPWPRVLRFNVRAYERWRGGTWERMRDAALPRLARVRVVGS